MRSFFFLALAAPLFAGCWGEGQTCQSGAKYGTQCYNSQGQGVQTSPGSTSSPASTSPAAQPTTPQR